MEFVWVVMFSFAIPLSFVFYAFCFLCFFHSSSIVQVSSPSYKFTRFRFLSFKFSLCISTKFLPNYYHALAHSLSHLHLSILIFRKYTTGSLHTHAWNITRVHGTPIYSACWSINIYIAEKQNVCATNKHFNRSRDH